MASKEPTEAVRDDARDTDTGSRRRQSDGSGDVALQFVQGHGRAHYTAAEERAVVRKIDWALMPLLAMTYTIQYLDKTVMAQAAVYGLPASLGLRGQQFSWCQSVFFFGFMASQPLGSLALTKLAPRTVAVATTAAWSVVVVAMAGASDFAGMATARFFLGVAEGAISPAFTLMTGAWYTQAEIPLRMTFWYLGNGFAIVFQAVSSYGIGHIDTGIPVWKWFFFVYGAIGLLWSAVLWWRLPNNIVDCAFLSDAEKRVAVERIRANRTGIASTTFKSHQLIEALRDPKVWWTPLWTVTFMVPNTAVALFSPIIIKGLGFSNFQASLLTAPLGVTENIGLLLGGWAAYRFKNARLAIQMLVNVPSLLGAVLLAYMPPANKGARLAGLYILNFDIVGMPLLWALTSSNIAGHTKRTTANAVQFVGYGLGAIVGPQIYLESEAPHYPTALRVTIGCFCALQVLPLVLYAYLTRANKQKDARQAALGEHAAYQENEEFLDKTDGEQVRFRYIK